MPTAEEFLADTGAPSAEDFLGKEQSPQPIVRAPDISPQYWSPTFGSVPPEVAQGTAELMAKPIANLVRTPGQMVAAARGFGPIGVDYRKVTAPMTEEQVAKRMKESPAAAALIGGGQALGDLDSFFTSPLGITTLATAGLGSLPAGIERAVALGFSAQMAAQTPQIAREIGEELGKPEKDRDYSKISRLTVNALANTGFTVAGAVRGLAPGREPTAAPRREPAPEIPSTEAIPPQAPAPSPQEVPQPPPPTPAPPVQAEAAAVPPASPVIEGMERGESGLLKALTSLPEMTPERMRERIQEARQLIGESQLALETGDLTPEQQKFHRNTISNLQKEIEEDQAELGIVAKSETITEHAEPIINQAVDAALKGNIPKAEDLPVSPRNQARLHAALTKLSSAVKYAKAEGFMSEEGTETVPPSTAPTLPATPEIAKMGPAEAGAKDMLGNPLGTQYYATPEDWATWQQIQADKAAARQAGHPAALAQAFAKNEALKNKYGGSVPLPPKGTPPEPMVTMYHGEGGPGGAGVDTRFFTRDPVQAARYGPNVTQVEVPKSVADAAEAARKAQGIGTPGAILPQEWVKKATPMANPPAAPVTEIGEPAAAPAKLVAAAYMPEGATVPETGRNHPEILKRLGITGFEDPDSRNTPQFGFTDETGKFLTREKAAERAKLTGQDLKEFEPGEPAYSGEIESPTQPGTPISEAPTPPPEPAPVSMGAAVPSEFALSPNTPTGIKNATVDAERQRRGLPPAIQPLRRAFGEVWDRAMAMIDHDPGMVDTLIDSLRDKPRALTDIEDAIVLHRQVDLQNEYGKATRDLAQAFEDGRTDAVAEEKLRVARISDQLLDLYNIGKKVGTETGRGLAARRMMVNEDFSLAQMELETRAAKGGRPLTDAERQQVADLHARIADTERAYKEYRDAAERRMVELETAKSIAELKTSSAPRFDKRILAHAESIVSRMEAAAKPAADRLRERLSRMSAGVDPTIVTDAAIVGSAKIARLGLDLAKFTDEMIRDFGEKIRPMIADIWTEANRMIDAATARVPDPVKQAIKKAATLTEVKEAATKDIAAKFAKGEKDKISWQVQRLARELVKSGVTDREQLIDQIHSLLQDAIPGITRREAMDAISGYGQFKQLTRDQISVTLRGMKGEMQQLAKLEDMAAGQPPLKTGLERRTPTEAERRLIKEVNDAKLKFQIPVDNPATQLRSALDTLKAGLRTRIADYEDRIARGDYAKRPRRNVELDPEAQRLKAQAEKVKQQFQRGVQLERIKNMGRVERTSNWVVKWRRGFLLSGPVTLAKLTSAAVQRLAITPAEELIGGAISRAIPQVAAKAAREGGLNVRAEAQAITQGLTQGMRDAWQVLRTGQSDLDVLYGKAALVPPSVIDFFGHVHGALKAPVKRAEFARSFEKRSRAAINAGVDVSDPIVQSNLVIEAYKDANRSIFLQDNRVVTAYKRALAALEQPNRETGRVPLAGKAAATAARVLLPIVRVPTNIVAETMQYATGSVTGSARLARAFARGIETLKPEEADLIMRSLKKGSLGAAVMLLGYFNADVIGGYYQQGEKRKPGQPKAGTVQLYGYEISSYLIHNPLIETLQIGATVRRVAESKINKRDQEEQGITTGVLAAGLGLTEEVPFVRETMETAKAFNPRERGAFFGELGKSLAVPQALQSWAAYQDKDWRGRPIQRQPRTVLQHVEMGIPGLRENVPVKRQTTTP